MKLHRIPCLLGFTLLLSTGAGCEDDRGLSGIVAGQEDAGSEDGSADGRADGRDGGERMDARRDAAADRFIRMDASTADRRPDVPRDTSPREVGPDRAAADRPDSAASDAPVTDAGPDGPEPDAAPDQAPDAAPDAPPDIDPGVVMPTDNCRTACASLFDLTAACSVEGEDCTTATVDDSGGTEVRNICHENGIQKVATETSPSSSSYAINLVVKRADGTTCYIIDVFGEDGEPATWTFKAPGGAVLGRATVSDDETLLRCEASGLTFDITDASSCSGMEGEGTCEPDGPETCD